MMADLNKSDDNAVRRIVNGSSHIAFHLGSELKWGGSNSKATKLDLDEKIAIVRRLHRTLRKQEKS
jgi:hypothetical protein